MEGFRYVSAGRGGRRVPRPSVGRVSRAVRVDRSTPRGAQTSPAGRP